MEPDNKGTRKRAVLACDYCRKRKRRCDRDRPVCSLCREAGAHCMYREVENNRHNPEAAASAVEQRLDCIESLLTTTIQGLQCSNPLLPSPRPFERSIFSLERSPTASDVPRSPREALSKTLFDGPPNLTDLNNGDGGPMTIPVGHSTTTGSLLQMPPLTSFLGPFQKDLFFRVESKRTIPDEISFDPCPLSQIELPHLDRDTVNELVENYFALVNPQHPILDREEFIGSYKAVLDGSLQHDIDSALCLVILSLGTAACEQPVASTTDWLPGVQYFTPGLKILLILWPTSFGTSVNLPQALYLAALYFSYLARPLLAWRFVHIASTNLQHLLIRHQNYVEHDCSYADQQPIVRVCWAVFVLECDIIAEYHLPRSGIEHIIDTLPFPLCRGSLDREMLYWLADLSARKLLNRVHHVMYDRSIQSTRNQVGNTPNQVSRSIASVLQISTELHHQLNSWYDLLPSSIKPDNDDLDNYEPDLNKTIILQRFHAAGDIIFRPFLYHVCALPADTCLPAFMLECCATCIHHCRKFLSFVSKRLETPSGSTEIVMHSSVTSDIVCDDNLVTSRYRTLAATIILSLASLSPLLKHLVPDINSLDRITVTLLEKWAFPGSSIESMLSIATALAAKRRVVVHDT